MAKIDILQAVVANSVKAQ